MAPNPKLPDAGEQARALESRYGWLEPELVIELAAERFFPDEIAAVSSFGADSAVLLHMIAAIDRSLPVLFLDTYKHFGATLDYRDALVTDLGLTNVIAVEPDPVALAARDPKGDLNRRNPDACCALRKVEPMNRAMAPYGAWFTGRKRYQASTRSQLAVFEESDGRIRINPLAHWTPADIEGYMYTNDLRRHPLVRHGYLSIGCQPCTSPVEAGQSARSGRWAGQDKTECGIHITPAGVVRAASAGMGTG